MPTNLGTVVGLAQFDEGIHVVSRGLLDVAGGGLPILGMAQHTLQNNDKHKRVESGGRANR